MFKPPFRRLGLVGLLAGSTLMAPGAVSVGHAAGCVPSTEPFPLCATTTISGSSSGSLRVNLASPTALSAFNGAGGGVQLSGTGRVTALIIQPAAAPSNYLWFSKTTAPFGGERFDQAKGYSQDATGNYTLAAGNYTLYFLTDGAASTATITLGGLSGSNTLTVQRALPNTVDAVLTNAPIGGATVSAQGARAHSVSANNSLTARWLAVQHPTQVASTAASCFWNGPPPPEANTQPFCPGATFTTNSNPTLATQPSYRLASLTGPLNAGTYGIGGYAVDASAGGTLSVLGVWLTLTG